MFNLKEIVKFVCRCGKIWIVSSDICEFCGHKSTIFNSLRKEMKDAKGIS